MADIQISGTTKLGGAFAKSAQAYGDRPGQTDVHLGTSNSDGTFTFYFTTTGTGTYKVYTKNQNGLKGPEYSMQFDAGPFEWNVGDITIYGFKLTGTVKYNGIEGTPGRPILFRPPSGTFSSLGTSGLPDGGFTYYVEPGQTGTCEVKSKNPYDEESSVYSFSFTTSSSQWSLGTLNVPILRINLSGNAYVSKDYGYNVDIDIQVSITDTCRTDKETPSGDWRNTNNYENHDATEHSTYWQISFSGSGLYMPLSKLNTTLYVYSRDHNCQPYGMPISNIISFSSSTNEYSSQVTFKTPPDLQIDL